jgi:hypothetical protein
MGGFFGKLKKASTTVADSVGFQERMATGMRDFPGQILLLLSGNDYTAKEFLEYVSSAKTWRGVLEQPSIERIDIDGADHTFSSFAWRTAVERHCVAWLNAQQGAPAATSL